MKFWLIKPECTITLETDEPDFWKTHAAALEAMGIKDLSPVVDNQHAAEVSRIALRAHEKQQSVANAVAGGKRTGKASKKGK